MLGLTWRPAARRDLNAILEYISDRDSEAAERLRTRIFEAIDLARQFPELYRKGRLLGTREIVAHSNYVIVYSVLTERIRIIAVLHARQRYP